MKVGFVLKNLVTGKYLGYLDMYVLSACGWTLDITEAGVYEQRNLIEFLAEHNKGLEDVYQIVKVYSQNY